MLPEFLKQLSLLKIIKSSTSVGANYSEAQSASSYKDFHNKIRIALKQLQETDFWIAFFIKANPDLTVLQEIKNENIELIKILSTISKKTESKTNISR